MKRRILLALTALAAALTLAGCEFGSKTAVNTFGDTTNGIYLAKDLTVKDCMLYDFEESKYDVKEYTGFLTEELNDYNKKHAYEDSKGNSISAITAETVSVKKDVLTQILNYYDVSDLVNYNKIELQKRGGTNLKAGTLDQLNEEVLAAQLISTGDSPFSAEDTALGKNAENYRYLVCNFKAVLYGEGNIVAYSSNAVYTEDLNCVTANGGENVVVIFK